MFSGQAAQPAPAGSITRLLAMCALTILALWAISGEFGRVVAPHGLWDFGAFLASGRAAAEGLDPYGIYPPLTPHVTFPGFKAWNPNLNPPISALLFQLFDFGDPATAKNVWLGASIVAYAAAVFLLIRRYAHGPEGFAIGIWAFALAGFWDTLFLGQIYVPLVTASVGAWLLLERGSTVWAGVLIGLVIAMKPNFLVWPVLLFLSGSYRPAIVSGVVAGLISAVPLLVFGPGIYMQWITLVLGDGDRAFFLTNASFSGLSARMGVPVLGSIAGLALLLGVAAWAFWRRPDVMRVSGLALLVSVQASPLGWIHYTLFLLPVLLHHWRRPWIWLVAALLTIPVPLVLGFFGASALVQSTVGSVYGWALLLLLAVLVIDEVMSVTEARGRSSRSASVPQPGNAL